MHRVESNENFIQLILNLYLTDKTKSWSKGITWGNGMQGLIELKKLSYLSLVKPNFILQPQILITINEPTTASPRISLANSNNLN